MQTYVKSSLELQMIRFSMVMICHILSVFFLKEMSQNLFLVGMEIYKIK